MSAILQKMCAFVQEYGGGARFCRNNARSQRARQNCMGTKWVGLVNIYVLLSIGHHTLVKRVIDFVFRCCLLLLLLVLLMFRAQISTEHISSCCSRICDPALYYFIILYVQNSKNLKLSLYINVYLQPTTTSTTNTHNNPLFHISNKSKSFELLLRKRY